MPNKNTWKPLNCVGAPGVCWSTYWIRVQSFSLGLWSPIGYRNVRDQMKWEQLHVFRSSSNVTNYLTKKLAKYPVAVTYTSVGRVSHCLHIVREVIDNWCVFSSLELSHHWYASAASIKISVRMIIPLSSMSSRLHIHSVLIPLLLSHFVTNSHMVGIYNFFTWLSPDGVEYGDFFSIHLPFSP